MTTIITIALLGVLTGSLAALITYYWATSRWGKYAAGRVFMYLLWAFTALVGYSLVSRFVEPRELRLNIYNGLIFALIAVIWTIIIVIAKSRSAARAERIRRSAESYKEKEI